jgi:hypothetical protein
MRYTWSEIAWATRTAALMAAAALAPLAGPVAFALGAQGEPPAAVTVPRDAVLSSPYTVQLAPTGELRVLTFPDALVSSVVVAKPWLLTVVVQGHDVVLQAKASSGTTQLIVYAGGVGTLWTVAIGPHGPAAARIIVAEGHAPESAAGAPRRAASESPAGPPMPPRLKAFVDGLSADQRAAFQAWQAQPTMEKLSDFLALLDTTQRSQFEALVAAGQVTAPRAEPAPRIVETTTVLRAETPPPAGGGPQRAAGAAPSGPGSALVATAQRVPQGLAVTASAERSRDGIVVRYTVTSQAGALPRWTAISAVDGTGAARDVSAAAPQASGQGSVSGTVTAHGSAPLPLTLVWRGEGGEPLFYVIVTD